MPTPSRRSTRRAKLAALTIALGLTSGTLASSDVVSPRPASQSGSLAVGSFLVSRPGLPDPNFFDTAVLLLAGLASQYIQEKIS